jgi:hypothetical protein
MPITDETRELAQDLIKFMQSKYGFDRIPRIRFVSNKKNAHNVLGMTGGYDTNGESITVYVADRHPKDILRSLAHEMLHHVQKCEGFMDGHDMGATSDPNYIMHDDFLKKVEADAFERGNITFREWEATKKGDKTMSESKKMSKPEIKAKHKKAKEAMPSFVKQYGKKEGEKIAYATAMSGKMDEEMELEEASKPDYLDLDKDGNKKEPMKKAAKDAKKDKGEDKEEVNENVEINTALRDSHNYSTVTRALPNVAKERDEFIFAELLKKFGIKK